MTETVNKPALATKQKNTCLLLNAPKTQARQRTVVVLGVERGGTSMAAGIIRALGVNMGDRAGLNHEDPKFLVDDRAKLANRIKDRNKQLDVWGFKVPKASLHLDFYETALRNPHYVIVYRNSLSIVDSWTQRGAGAPVDVLERIAEYHAALLHLMKTSRHPILLLNYERAVGDATSKNQVVEELASFCGTTLTDDLRERASGMMTGDGKGYVNLPEHFFHADALQMPGDRAPIPLVEIAPEDRGEDGWATHEKPRPILKFRRSDGENLPKQFWLKLDLDTEGLDLASNPLRIFFNFTGTYFPGHCARPAVQHGRNTFWVETSGNATDFALGPISVPARIRASAEMFAAVDGDQPQASAPVAAASAKIAPKRSILSRALKRAIK